MVEVNWTVDVVSDIDGIATYIARDSPRSAQDIVERFLAAADVLERYPLKGKPVPEIRLSTVRELLVVADTIICCPECYCEYRRHDHLVAYTSRQLLGRAF